MSIGTYAENRIIDAIFNATSLSITNTYAKLHIGNPGEDGTANAAVETTRKVASWAAASGGASVLDAALTWTSVAGTEDYSHISFWDASAAGNHLWNGPMTTSFHVNAGDTFTIPAGNGTATID